MASSSFGQAVWGTTRVRATAHVDKTFVHSKKEVPSDKHRLRGHEYARQDPRRHCRSRRAIPVPHLPLRHHRQGASLPDEIVECAQLAYGRNRIEFAVNTCTEYSDRRQPSLRAMEEIAWVLRSDPKKNQVGFVRRAELTRRERFALDADPLDDA